HGPEVHLDVPERGGVERLQAHLPAGADGARRRDACAALLRAAGAAGQREHSGAGPAAAAERERSGAVRRGRVSGVTTDRPAPRPGRRPRAAWGATAACALAVAGCYHYVPADPAEPRAGTPVRVQLEPP